MLCTVWPLRKEGKFISSRKKPNGNVLQRLLNSGVHQVRSQCSGMEYSLGLTGLWGVFLLLRQLTVCIFPLLSNKQGAGCSDDVFLYNGKETSEQLLLISLVHVSHSWARSSPTVPWTTLSIQLGRVNWSQSLWHNIFCFLFGPAFCWW